MSAGVSPKTTMRALPAHASPLVRGMLGLTLASLIVSSLLLAGRDSKVSNAAQPSNQLNNFKTLDGGNDAPTD